MLTYMLTFVNFIMLSSILNNFIDYIKYLRLRLKVLQIEMFIKIILYLLFEYIFFKHLQYQ